MRAYTLILFLTSCSIGSLHGEGLPPADVTISRRLRGEDPLSFLRLANKAEMPPVVRRALQFLPFLKSEQVMMLPNVESLRGQLVQRGYTGEAVGETIKAVRGFAEFTIDHRFPIYINAGSWHYRRIAASWERGQFPDEAARVLASDLYHEYQHAACGQAEVAALEAHVGILKSWRANGLLTIADPYIVAKEAELREERTRETAEEARRNLRSCGETQTVAANR